MSERARALWSVFWRTFAALALPVVLAAQALDWAVTGNWTSNTIIFGLGLLGAAVGALVALLMAASLGFAETPLGKALRAFVQALAQVLSGFVFVKVADLAQDVKLLEAGIPVVILAFAVAYFANQGPVPNLGTTPSPRSAVRDAFTRKAP